jgi:hypothetical protein
MSPRFGSGRELELVAEAVAAAPGDRDPQELPLALAGDEGAHLVARGLGQADQALAPLPGRGKRVAARKGGGSGMGALSPIARPNQAPRHGNRVREAPGAGDPLAGDRERGAVVGARADVARPERHVHRILKVDRLERRQALVVVEGHRHVELAAQLAPEERVGRLGPGEPGKPGRARPGSGRSCRAPRCRSARPPRRAG